MGANIVNMNSSRFGGNTAVKARIQRERLLYIGGGALVFALVLMGVLIFYAKSSVQAVQQQANVQPISESVFGRVVLVAPTSPVPEGAKLDQVQVKELQWPRNEVPEGAIRDLGELSGMYAKVGLPANQPILRANLSSSPPVNVIAGLLPPGHRAISIEVDATSSVEGWATPGAHVDLHVTYYDQTEKTQITRVAVEDAVVLSYDGQMQRTVSSTEAKPQSASTVTLAVSAKDALKVQTAKAMGRISLVLRNTEDASSIGGDDKFSGLDFVQPEDKKSVSPSTPKGFVSFSNKDGKRSEFQLYEDGGWAKIENPDL